MILVRTVMWLERKYPPLRAILNNILPSDCVVRIYEKKYKDTSVIYIELHHKQKMVKYAFLSDIGEEEFYKSLEIDLKRIVEKEFKV